MARLPRRYLRLSPQNVSSDPGNVVGSNIFNVLCILGVTSVVQPIDVAFGAVASDLWVMLGVSVVLVPFLVTGLRLGRREGAVLLTL